MASSEVPFARTQSSASGTDDPGESTSDSQSDVRGNKFPSAWTIAVFIVGLSMVMGLCWCVYEVCMCEVRHHREVRAHHQLEESEVRPEDIEMTDMGTARQGVMDRARGVHNGQD